MCAAEDSLHTRNTEAKNSGLQVRRLDGGTPAAHANAKIPPCLILVYIYRERETETETGGRVVSLSSPS